MKNGCAVCEAKMVHGYKSEERILKPMIRKEGKLVPVSMDEAVHKAAQILTDAKYPLAVRLEQLNQRSTTHRRSC